MPITINGSGTIAGISVGGLENGCVNEADLATAAVSNSKLSANAVTIDKMGTTEQSQLCKAWVNFNGTSTVAIRASYNVSSITDNATGDYTVNFTTAMPDASYVPVITTVVRDNQTAGTSPPGLKSIGNHTSPNASLTASSVNILHRPTSVDNDADMYGVAIFR